MNPRVSPKATAPEPAVILLGGYENGLSVARSLGPAGIPVYAAGCGRNLRFSRWVRWIPPEETGMTQSSWLHWLLHEGLRLEGSVLLPCNDEALELVARDHVAIRRHYRLMEIDAEATEAMLDKAKTADLAAKLGIPAPRVWVVSEREELLARLPEIFYPCALKPRHSHRFHRLFGLRKLFVADGPEALLARFDETAALGLQMIVTEIIPGRDDECCGYWTYIDGQGEPLYHFTKRKLRQFPPHFGIGTLHASEPIPEVAELGFRFVKGVGLRGPAVVEFKRDARDGLLKLIECNARLVNPHELAARSGLDLSRLLYDHLAGRPRRPQPALRQARLWFPVRDIRAFRRYRALGELSTRRWLGSLRPGISVAPFHWSDPLPLFGPLIDRVRDRLVPPATEVERRAREARRA